MSQNTYTLHCTTLETWRNLARHALMADIAPERIIWHDNEAQGGLFMDALPTVDTSAPSASVPKAFMALANKAACHRSAQRWNVLYRVVWRLNHGERELLNISVDEDVQQLHRMVKEVSRDAHKMKAFVRFKRVDTQDNRETFVAWHEPSHYVVPLTAPFFVRRFAAMDFTILTPDISLHWDGEALTFSEGVPRSHAPKHDDLEALWKTFYQHIFNPARIKMQMMKSEMPKKYWHTMSETALIPSMLEEADARVAAMIAQQQVSSDDIES